ncbi:MAG: hypothetical protein HYS59_01960 [Candidatus Vogelbacteria bacterium]|nr:hypothetical protein [Candidatus Vogelbacteria bacterium]
MQFRGVWKKVLTGAGVLFSMTLCLHLFLGAVDEQSSVASWSRRGFLRGQWYHGSPSEEDAPTGEIPVRVWRRQSVLIIEDTLPPHRTVGFKARLSRAVDHFGERAWRGTFSVGVLLPTEEKGRYILDPHQFESGMLDLDDALCGELTQINKGSEKYEPDPDDYGNFIKEVRTRLLPKLWTGVARIKIVLN